MEMVGILIFCLVVLQWPNNVYSTVLDQPEKHESKSNQIKVQRDKDYMFKSMNFVTKSVTFTDDKPVDGRFIDLKLPVDKQPLDLQDFTWRRAKVQARKLMENFIKQEEGDSWKNIQKLRLKEGQKMLINAYNQEEGALKKMEEARKFIKKTRNLKEEDLKEIIRKNAGNKTVVLGSEEEIYAKENNGLLGAVMEAYNNHWNLRVSPDDFWFPIARHVASTIDKKSKSNKVRKFFVNFEGKKELTVLVPSPTIYGIDYSWLFDQFSKQLKKNINVPEYVNAIQSDFTTTTPELKVVSDINLMSSLQEYFEYTSELMCGIKGVEMIGTKEDWQKLQTKLEKLKQILSPIEDVLKLSKWFEGVKDVYVKLLETYDGSPDTKWWSNIFSHEKAWGSGMPPKFSGWVIHFLSGRKEVTSISSIFNGLSSVPMKFRMGEVEDTAALVAGMLGFTVYDGKETGNGIPSVKPFQGWALLLPEDSPFRFKKSKETKGKATENQTKELMN